MSSRLHLSTFLPLRASLKSWQKIAILAFEQTTRIDLRSKTWLQRNPKLTLQWHNTSQLNSVVLLYSNFHTQKMFLTGVVDTYFGFAFLFFYFILLIQIDLKLLTNFS